MLYREHEFYITCEGEKLEEYDIRLESEGTISCLIPSEAGKKFGIRCHAFGEMDAVVDYYVDGTYLHSGTLTKNCWYHVRGIQIDTATYRPLQFTNVIVTDDDDAGAPDSRAGDRLGEIELRVFRAIKGAKTRPWQPSGFRFQARGPIHESAKTLGAHCVSLGDPIERINNKSSRDGTLLDPKSEPYAKFLYRYRPLEVLRAQGRVPWHPSVTDRASDRERVATMVGKRRSTDSPEHCDLLHTKRTRSTSTEWSAAGPFSESQSELDLDPLLTEDTKPDIKPIVNQNDDMRTLQSQFDEMQESMRAMQESMKAIKAKMDQIQTGEQSPRSESVKPT